MLPNALAADANVVLSALIGGRARLVFSHPRGPRCFAAQAVRDEVLEHLPRLARRRGLALDALLLALELIPVSWQPETTYAPFEPEARKRMAMRDPDDWPTVALALALDLPVWSQDKDFVVAHVPVYTTGQLLDALRAIDETDPT
ncbi:MAG: PIN domain-containing protein [Dehalococcoidia bacterium]